MKKADEYRLAVGVAVVSSLVAIGIVLLINQQPTIKINDNDSMKAWAGIIKASDGQEYRVTATILYFGKSEPNLVVDATSKGERRAFVAGSRGIKSAAWEAVQSCTLLEYRDRKTCSDEDDEAEDLLGELSERIMTRRHIVSNFDLYWAWEQETKTMNHQLSKF
jgi:hypothetical protein